jgi:hypothetical protein
MIAKKKIGTGFRGAAEYDLGKHGGILLETNMASVKPSAMAREFAAIKRLRPNLKKAVLHVSISAAPGECLTNAQWLEIGKRYLATMGLDKNQYVITRHTDTEHEHIHILANRVRFDGTVTSDSNDYKRQEVLMRALERDYSMAPVCASRDAPLRAIGSGEIEMALRTGVRPSRLVLQELVSAATLGRPSMIDFMRRLESKGVCVIPNIANTGRMNGFTFEFDGTMFSGSKLGAKFKWSELQKEIEYEQTRDSQELAARRDRARRSADAQSSRGTSPYDFCAGDGDRGTDAIHEAVSTSGPDGPQRGAADRPVTRRPNPVGWVDELALADLGGSDSKASRWQHANSRSSGEQRRDLEKARSAARANGTKDIIREARTEKIEPFRVVGIHGQRLDGQAAMPGPKQRISNGCVVPRHRNSYRDCMLQQEYGSSSAILSQYWRIKRCRPECQLVFENKHGQVVDKGVSVTARQGNNIELVAMIELAKLKGWTKIKVAGSEDFRFRAMTAALLDGIGITPSTSSDLALLARAQMQAIAERVALATARNTDRTNSNHFSPPLHAPQ